MNKKLKGGFSVAQGRPRKSCRWQVCRGAGELRAQARMSRLAKEAFTLAEVLITLAIIGVVAAVAVPSVISNSQQQEFRTGLRKAVSVLNSAITMNMALDGETPYDNANLFGFLMKHMAVVESFSDLTKKYWIKQPDDDIATHNGVFYTTDGMRFELFNGWAYHYVYYLYENPSVQLCTNVWGTSEKYPACGGCGSYGLNSNSNDTTKPPCLITVDVNGDRKPSPKNVNCMDNSCFAQNTYKFSDPLGLKLGDVFSIMITDKEAIPYGVAAQRAMYQAQK